MSNSNPIFEAANQLNHVEKVELIKAVFATLPPEAQSSVASFSVRKVQTNQDQAQRAKGVYTTSQAAKILGVSNQTLASWFDSGKLRGYRIPGNQVIRIKHESLASLLAKQDKSDLIPDVDGKQICYTAGQAAKIFAVTSKTIKRWVQSGKLRGYSIPGSQDRRIPHEDLMAFAAKQGRSINEAA